MVCTTGCSIGGQGNEKYVIGSVVYDESGEWFQEVMDGMAAAAKDYDVKLIKKNAHYDPQSEKQIISQFVKDDVDAITTCPLDYQDSAKSVKEAMDAGVPVITWNTTVATDTTSKICVDPTVLGGATGEFLVKYFEENNLSGVKMALLTNECYEIGVQRCEGFKKAIDQLVKDGRIELVAETPAELIEEGKVAVKRILAEHPDVQLFWCWNQMSLIACVEVLKEMNRTDILATGTDMSVDLAKDMLSDEVQLLAVTTQKPYEIGYQAVENAVKAAKGEKVKDTVMIETQTYLKSDKEALNQYVKEHKGYLGEK